MSLFIERNPTPLMKDRLYPFLIRSQIILYVSVNKNGEIYTMIRFEIIPKYCTYVTESDKRGLILSWQKISN